MPLIIDGNNLLHTPMPPSLAGLEEAGLCRLLARGPWAGEAMTVVCDGVPGVLSLRESPEPGVALVFAGANHEADDVIIAMIAADSAPRRLVVVSNDREIRQAARRRRAHVWSCEQLIHALSASISGKGATMPAARKGDIGPLDEDQVARWMKQFGVKGDEVDVKTQPWWDPMLDELDESTDNP